MRLVYSVLILLCICLMSGCLSESEREAIRLMDRAESLLQSDPHGAYEVLDSVKHPESLNSRFVSRWCMMVGYLSDTIHTPLPYLDDLDRACMYLAKHGSVKEQALMLYYWGRSLSEERLYSPALQAFLEAEQKSLEEKDYKMAGMASDYIARIYHNQVNYNLAKNEYLETAEYFRKAGDRKRFGFSLRYVGREYAALDSFEQALNYMSLAYDVIVEVGDSSDISTVYNGVGNVYLMQGDYESAKRCFYKSIAWCSRHASPTYAALGYLYLNTDSFSQAEHCFREAQKPTENRATHIDLLHHFAELEEKKGNSAKALSYMKQYVDSTESYIIGLRKSNLDKAKTLFDRKLMVKENIRLYKEQERYKGVFVCMVFVVILVIITHLYQMNRKSRRIIQQEQDLQEKIEAQHSLQKEIQELNEQLKQKLQDEQEYNRLLEHSRKLRIQYQQQCIYLVENSTIYKKMCKAADPQKQTALTEKDWNAIYKLLDSLYPSLDAVLSRHGLTLTEKKYAYLSFFRLEDKQEAILFAVEAGTPKKYHNRIRQKLGINRMEEKVYLYLARHSQALS